MHGIVFVVFFGFALADGEDAAATTTACATKHEPPKTNKEHDGEDACEKVEKDGLMLFVGDFSLIIERVEVVLHFVCGRIARTHGGRFSELLHALSKDFACLFWKNGDFHFTISFIDDYILGVSFGNVGFDV